MTNKTITVEEAIEMLKSKMDGHTDTSYEWAETVRMAIKALEYYKFKEDFMEHLKNSHCGYDGDNPNRF